MTGKQLRDTIDLLVGGLMMSPASYFTGALGYKAKAETRELWRLSRSMREKLEEQWVWVDANQAHPQAGTIISETIENMRAYERAVSTVTTILETYGFPLEEQAGLAISGGYHYA